MRFPRKMIILLIGIVSLSLMAGLLLAQDAEGTEEPPLVIDCSPQGLRDLNNLITQEYGSNFGQSTQEIVDAFATVGSIYEEIALVCGQIHPTKPSSKTIVRELVDYLAELNSQSIVADPALLMSIDPKTLSDKVMALTGDPVRGMALYNSDERTTLRSRINCAGCHEGVLYGLRTDEIWDLTVNERLHLPQFEGYTPEEYIIESILLPDAYVVPLYGSGIMPYDAVKMSAQDVADLIAYLHNLSTDEANE